MNERSSPDENEVATRQAESGGRSRGKLRDSSRTSERERRLDIRIVGEGLQCLIELLIAELTFQLAVPADERVPSVELVDGAEQLAGMRAEAVNELRIELRAPS